MTEKKAYVDALLEHRLYRSTGHVGVQPTCGNWGEDLPSHVMSSSDYNPRLSLVPAVASLCYYRSV